jgi:hypothetical protein
MDSAFMTLHCSGDCVTVRRVQTGGFMMCDRWLRAGFAATAILVLAALPAAAQAPSSKVPRTPDGKPSLEGTFTFSTITPMQRPQAFADKSTLTPEEAEEFERAENLRLNRDLFDPEKGQPSAGYPPRSQGGVLSYNEFWYERGNQLTEDRRTALITDPPDGRIPYNDQTRREVSQRGQLLYAGFADNYEDRSLADRCLMGFNAGPPMSPGAYNNNLQIVQTRDHVMLMTEMVHSARIIPIDGRPHGTLRKWLGDSRGRWEGDTLVVETTNFLKGTSLSGSTDGMKLIERFTRVDEGTIKYEFTVSDPNSYTRPWSAMFPLVKIDEPIYEYACHEGNYAMEGILKGARLLEKLKPESK